MRLAETVSHRGRFLVLLALITLTLAATVMRPHRRGHHKRHRAVGVGLCSERHMKSTYVPRGSTYSYSYTTR